MEFAAKAALAEIGEEREPEEHEIEAMRAVLVNAAVAPFSDSDARETIVALQRSVEQIIDLERRDTVLYAGPVDRNEAEEVVQSFKRFIEERHDEFVALKVFCSKKSHKPDKVLPPAGTVIHSDHGSQFRSLSVGAATRPSSQQRADGEAEQPTEQGEQAEEPQEPTVTVLTRPTVVNRERVHEDDDPGDQACAS